MASREFNRRADIVDGVIDSLDAGRHIQWCKGVHDSVRPIVWAPEFDDAAAQQQVTELLSEHMATCTRFAGRVATQG